MHLLNMFSLKTINKIVQSGNIAHPLTLRICPFECFQWVYILIVFMNCWCTIYFVFVSCIVRSYFFSCVRLIKLTNETNDTRNERANYTNETQTSGIRKTNERCTQTKRTKNANDTKYLYKWLLNRADNMVMLYCILSSYAWLYIV
jgi:hypothetical protein